MVHPQSCIQRNDFWFCWTVRNWSLFLTHPTCWNKRMTSENAWCSTRSRVGVLKISYKIGVLKQSQSALFGSITHMAILFVFTCVMNVRDQTKWPFVTSLGPFLWSIVQNCSQTIEYSIRISEQFESILLAILPRISCLLLWNGGHQCTELILCRVVESPYLPTHNIVPHISWHDLPCHKTMKKYEDLPSMVIFQLLRRNAWNRTWFWTTSLLISHCPLRTSQVYMIKERCWFSQINFFVEYFSTSDQDFVSFQPILCHPHTQIRIILFHDVQRDIPNFGNFLPTVL